MALPPELANTLELKVAFSVSGVVCAIRCNPALKAVYRRLKADGKKPEVALVAVMRKLINLLNALLRDDRQQTPEPPPREVPA